MKKIKFITVMLLLAALTLNFNACSSDDEDLKNGTNGKRITKIVNEYGKNDITIRTEIFSYSNGKMSKYTAQYDGSTNYENNQTITYSNNTVTLTGLFDGNDCVQTYTLNNNGLATSCKIVNNGKNWEKNYTFQYSDNYLIGMSYTYSSEHYNSSETYTFSYSSGDMTNVTHKDAYETENYTFTYSNNENKGCLINEFIGDDLFEHRAAFYAGILGKATKNLAISSTNSFKLRDKWVTENYTCVYSLDNDGYVKTAISSSGDKFTYTFE